MGDILPIKSNSADIIISLDEKDALLKPFNDYFSNSNHILVSIFIIRYIPPASTDLDLQKIIFKVNNRKSFLIFEYGSDILVRQTNVMIQKEGFTSNELTLEADYSEYFNSSGYTGEYFVLHKVVLQKLAVMLYLSIYDALNLYFCTIKYSLILKKLPKNIKTNIARFLQSKFKKSFSQKLTKKYIEFIIPYFPNNVNVYISESCPK